MFGKLSRIDPKYISAMNDDQVFDADFLRYLVETAESNPRSVVGPLLLLWDQPHKVFQKLPPVWNTWLGGWQHWFQQTVWTVPERPFEVDLIVGNCVLIPAETIKGCGLMNSKRYPNFGDAEYTPRLKRAGWKLLIDPRARVFCQPNTVPASVGKKSFGQMFNALFVDLKNVNSLRRRWFAYMDTAPSKVHGAAAFCIFIVRAFFRINPESPAFSEGNPDKSLYASALLILLSRVDPTKVPVNPGSQFKSSRTRAGGLRSWFESGFLRAVRMYTINTPIPRGKYRAFLAAKSICKTFPDNLIGTTKDGRQFSIDLSSGMQDTVYFLGEYEPAITTLIEPIIAKNECRTFIDAGANFGRYTTLFFKYARDVGSDTRSSRCR